jgi:hypothetical protein
MKKITLIASALALMGLAGCAHMGPRPVQEPIYAPADQWRIGNCSTSACNQTFSYAMRINRYGPESMPANILASHWETIAECAKTCAPNYAEIHDLLCKHGGLRTVAVFDNHDKLFPVFLTDPAIDPATFLVKGHYDIYLNKLHCGGNAK